MKYTLLFVLALCSCDARLLDTEQVKGIGQSTADIREAAKHLPNDPYDIRAALVALSNGIDAAMRIQPHDYKPRVSLQQWQEDSKQALGATEANAKATADTGAVWWVASSAVGGALLVGLMRLGAGALAAHPLGGILHSFDRMLGDSSLKEKRVAKQTMDKVFDILDEHKKIDPKWEEHYIHKQLAERLRHEEDDYVKACRDERA